MSNILCIDEKPKEIMDRIGEIFHIKDGSINTPKKYLGANIKKWKLQDEDGTN